MPLGILRFFLPHLRGSQLHYAMLASVANSSRLLHIPRSNQFQKCFNPRSGSSQQRPHRSLPMHCYFSLCSDKSKFYKEGFILVHDIRVPTHCGGTMDSWSGWEAAGHTSTETAAGTPIPSSYYSAQDLSPSIPGGLLS